MERKILDTLLRLPSGLGEDWYYVGSTLWKWQNDRFPGYWIERTYLRDGYVYRLKDRQQRVLSSEPKWKPWPEFVAEVVAQILGEDR